MQNIPTIIFLRPDYENNPTDDFNEFDHECTYWTDNRIDSRDIEYVLLSEVQNEIIRLKKKCNELIATLDSFGASRTNRK